MLRSSQVSARDPIGAGPDWTRRARVRESARVRLAAGSGAALTTAGEVQHQPRCVGARTAVASFASTRRRTMQAGKVIVSSFAALVLVATAAGSTAARAP